jgi:Copper amine oxidase N-terminal domain
MSVSPGMTSAEDPEEDTPTELPAFGLTVSPGCEKILLSWQTYTDAKTVVVKRDGEQSAMFYSGETIWLDKNPSTESHTYQIEALDENKEVIAKSWEISAKSSCYDPDICKTELKYRLNSTDYWVNGSQKGPMDTPPEISFGRMFLVIRYVTQELGAELTWEGTEKKLTITTATGKVIDLWIGRSIAMVDGASVAIDSSNMSVAPYIKAGRTLLPMRFVASQLGASGDDDVVWNDETKTVTLKVFDPACPEPDVSFLTVTDIDSTKWLVHCIDSARNPVEVLLDQEYSIFSGTLKAGELVSVTGTPTRKNRDTIEIEARWLKLIEDDLEEIKCLPIKSENGELTYQITSPKNETEPPASDEEDEDEEEEEPEIKDEDEEEGGEEPEIEDEEEEKDDEEEEEKPISETQTITLKYNKSFTEIESSVNQYWVRIIKKGDSDEIIWWEPIIFSATGEDIEQSNHSVSIGGIDTKKNRIKVNFDDGLEVYNDWVYFPIGFDLEDIDQTNCQKITFHKNYLGNRVAEPSAEEAACTTPYKLLSQSDSMLFYPGQREPQSSLSRTCLRKLPISRHTS